MALDTKEKRSSVFGVGRPWMRDKFPVATPDEQWRVGSGNAYNANTFLNSYSLSLESGAYTISGSSVTVKKGYSLSLEGGSYTWSGSSVTFLRTYVLAIESGSYIIGGRSVMLTYSEELDGTGTTLRRRRRQ